MFSDGVPLSPAQILLSSVKLAVPEWDLVPCMPEVSIRVSGVRMGYEKVFHLESRSPWYLLSLLDLWGGTHGSMAAVYVGGWEIKLCLQAATYHEPHNISLRVL